MSRTVVSSSCLIDFSNLLYLATGDIKYHDDAKKAIDFTKASLTSNGVITHRGTDNNTWADEMARGLGNLVQWPSSRNDNQRWWIDVQPDGSYKIWNKATGAALDGSSSSANGFKLVQWGWNGGDQQRWVLK